MNDFEVIFVNKFSDTHLFQIVLEAMNKRFHLQSDICRRLACGQPVTIKQHLNLETAEQFRRAIAATGGTCWIQKQHSQGQPRERRCNDRRLRTTSRRKIRRDNAIQPDRRLNLDRRQHTIH